MINAIFWSEKECIILTSRFSMFIFKHGTSVDNGTTWCFKEKLCILQG